MFNHGDGVTFSPAVSGSGSLTQMGTGILTVLGSNSYSGGTTISRGTLHVGNGGSGASIGGTSNMLNNGSLVFNHGDGVTFSPVISGSGSLAQTGTGVLTLAGSNSYNGGTTISGGAVSLNNANALPNSTVMVSVNNGLLFNSNSGAITTFNVGGLAGSGSIILADGSYPVVLSAGGDGAGTTYSGVLGGSGGLNKIGSGMLRLSNTANSYSGGTMINMGTISFANGALGSGNITFGGGTLQWAVGNTQDVSASVAPISLGLAAIFDTNGNNVSLAAALGGSGNLIKVGNGILTLAGGNSYSGGTAISAGAISLNNANALPNSTVTVSVNNGLLFNSSSGAITTFNLGGLAGSGSIILADGSYPVVLSAGGNGAGTTYSGVLGGSGGLTKTGSGTLTLSNAANAYSGGTTINMGTISFANGALGSGNITFGGGTLQWAVGNTQDVSAHVAPIGPGLTAIVDTNGNNVSLAAALGGSGNLIKVGNGILTLAGSNSYSGGTAISGGTLQVGNTSALGPATNSLTINVGTLDMHGYNVSLGSLAGSGTIDNLSGAASYTLGVGYGNANSTFFGTLRNTSGKIVLMKVGTGVITLAGNVSLGGSCSVTSGTLNQPAGIATLSNSLYLGYTASSSGSYNLSGSGLLSVSGTEIVGYSGAGTFIESGGTNNLSGSNGSLYLGNNAGGSGTYSLSGSGLLSAWYEYVGSSGTGTFTQSGGNSSAYFLYLGNNAGGSGTYNLSGTGLLSANEEYVGSSGRGSYTQSGGTNSVGYAGLYLANNAGGSGTYNLSGSGQLSAPYECVGYSGTGIFTQTGGTNTIANTLYLGNMTGGSGTYNLSGSGLLSAASEYLGYWSAGSFTQSGGTNSTASTLCVGYFASGSYNLSGSGLLSADYEYVGSSGTGTFTQSGGTNSILSGGSLYLGQSYYSSGTYTLTGSGTLIVGSGGQLRVGADSGSGRLEWLTNTSTLRTPTLTLGSDGTLALGFDLSGGVGELAVGLHAVVLAVPGEVADRQIDVGVLHGGGDVVDPDTARRHRQRIELDPHRILL